MSTAFELRQELARLSRVNLTDAAFPALLKRIGALTKDMQVVVGMTGGGEMFFRGRSDLKSKPLHCSELAAAPAAKIAGYGRCNQPNQPMFYASSRRSAAILEIDAKVGDRVYLGQWIGKQQLPINRIFDASLEDDWRQRLSDKSHILHGYLEGLFTRSFGIKFSNEYKLTAAIAEHLTTEFTMGDDRHDVHADGTIALRYPSVVDIENSYNTVMHGVFAEERLDLLHVLELTVDKIDGTQVSCSITDNAFDIENGVISWSGNAGAYPAHRPNGHGLFFCTGEKWRIALATDPGNSCVSQDMIDENTPRWANLAAASG